MRRVASLGTHDTGVFGQHRPCQVQQNPPGPSLQRLWLHGIKVRFWMKKSKPLPTEVWHGWDQLAGIDEVTFRQCL